MARNASVATEAIFDIPALRPERKNLLVGEPPQTRCFGPTWPEAAESVPTPGNAAGRGQEQLSGRTEKKRTG